MSNYKSMWVKEVSIQGKDCKTERTFLWRCSWQNFRETDLYSPHAPETPVCEHPLLTQASPHSCCFQSSVKRMLLSFILHSFVLCNLLGSVEKINWIILVLGRLENNGSSSYGCGAQTASIHPQGTMNGGENWFWLHYLKSQNFSRNLTK